jgi:ElaB/YqjD/DUF883 family membrane-anchored ribosome-binding protein
MKATFADNGRDSRTGGQAIEVDGVDTSPAQRSARSQEISDLIADVQDLLSRVGHLADPEIAQLRARVEQGLATAKQALVDGSNQAQRRARHALSAGDDYVRDQPWQAVGIAAAAGLLVGYLVARR